MAFLAVLLPLALVGIAAPESASAASYRYWTYWWGTPGASSWSFAPAGPGAHTPADGAVEGWRFQTTSAAGGSPPSDGRSPSSVFSELCAGVAPTAGNKRVAVLIDYGTAADAPPGQSPPSPRLRGRCITAPMAATGATLMARAGATLRFDAGLLCAIDGYPRGECAPVVQTSPAPTTPKPATSKPATSKPSSSRPSTTRPATTAPAVPATTPSSPSSAPPSAPATSSAPSSPRASAAGAAPTPPSPAASSPPAATLPTAPQTAAEAAGTTPIATAVPVPAEGSTGGPWAALAGLLLVGGLGGAAVLRMRGPR